MGECAGRGAGSATLRLQVFDPLWADKHTLDQAHCVFDAEGAPLVDWWGTSENFDADWQGIVAEIGRRAGEPTLRAETGGVANARTSWAADAAPASSSEACSLERYAHLDAAAVRAIGLQYSMDAVRFGYLELPREHNVSRI